MKLRVPSVGLLLVAMSLCQPLWAHPGHGVTEPDSLTHYLTESIHAAPWWIAAAALAAGAGLAWRTWRRLA